MPDCRPEFDDPLIVLVRKSDRKYGHRGWPGPSAGHADPKACPVGGGVTNGGVSGTRVLGGLSAGRWS
jgi:hypothetical protein